MLSDQQWDDAYAKADALIPAEETGLRRQRLIFEQMGYKKISADEIDWSDLAKYFWDPAVPYPWTPEQLAEG